MEMGKKGFQTVLKNLQLLSPTALDEYRNVPLTTKLRFLMDELLDIDVSPENSLLAALLLRSLLMEDFNSLWNSITPRLEQFKFVEKIKIILLDNMACFAMRQVAIHMASIILNSNKLEQNIQLSFLEYLMTLIRSEDPIHQENVMLLFFLVAPVIKREANIWSAFINECKIIANHKYSGIIRNQLGLECMIFGNICEGKLDADIFIANKPNYQWIPRRLSTSFMQRELRSDDINYESRFEDNNVHRSNMTLRAKCFAQYGLAATGISKLDYVEMLVHADMRKRGIHLDSKPFYLFKTYFNLK